MTMKDRFATLEASHVSLMTDFELFVKEHEKRVTEQDAAKATAAARSRLDAIQVRLAKAAQVMRGVPAEDELQQQLTASSTVMPSV